MGETGSKGPGDTSKRKAGPGCAEKEQQWACQVWKTVRGVIRAQGGAWSLQERRAGSPPEGARLPDGRALP